MQGSVIPVGGCYPDVENAQLVYVKASIFKQVRKIQEYLPSGCTLFRSTNTTYRLVLRKPLHPQWKVINNEENKSLK